MKILSHCLQYVCTLYLANMYIYDIYLCVVLFFAVILIPPVYGVNIIGFQQAVNGKPNKKEITVNLHISFL